MSDVWILGATGRSGSDVAALLAARGVALTLVGRNEERLRKAAAGAGCPDATLVVADSVPAMTEAIARRKPSVVVNFLGGYAENAAPLARACLAAGSHYVDLAADVGGIGAVLDLHDEATTAGRTLVTAAGFGVLGTEAVVARLCVNRPGPESVRVDVIPSVAIGAGTVGTALAASIIDSVVHGARRYEAGRMVKASVGANPRTHHLSDGETAKTAVAPSGELLAAQRVSKAPNVEATTTFAPTSPVLRALMPALAALLSIEPVRRFATNRLAAIRLKAAPKPRTHSWGHAAMTWPDGTKAEAWLRMPDGSIFTANTTTEVVTRLLAGTAPTGAYTPASAFGPTLAEAAGGTFIN